MISRRRNRMLVASHSLFVLAIFGLGGASAADVSLAGESVELPSVSQGAKAPIKEIVFKKELTIGVVEGDENYMFGRSVGFNVDEAGNIYVLDWSKKHIKKYGPEGIYELTIGRPGQGPGDFQNPSVPRFTADGRIYVSENFRGLVHTFDQNGNFLGQTKLPDRIFEIRIASTGVRLGLRYQSPQYVGQGPTVSITTIFDDQYRPLIELDKDVMDPPIDRSLSLAQRQAEIATYFLGRPNPIAEMDVGGRIYFGRSDVYAVDVYSPDGKKIRTVTRNIKPVPYERKDIDLILKSYAESLYDDQPEAVRNEILKAIRFPKTKPAFRSIIPMEDGLFAVLIDSTATDEGVFDLFDDAGDFRGRVRMRIPLTGLLFRKGKAYCVARDADGYSFVERHAYEIR